MKYSSLRPHGMLAYEVWDRLKDDLDGREIDHELLDAGLSLLQNLFKAPLARLNQDRTGWDTYLVGELMADLVLDVLKSAWGDEYQKTLRFVVSTTNKYQMNRERVLREDQEQLAGHLKRLARYLVELIEF